MFLHHAAFCRKKLKDFDPRAPGSPFSRELFWDYPDLNIDPEKYTRLMIERLVMRGDLADFYTMLKIYDRDTIAET